MVESELDDIISLDALFAVWTQAGLDEHNESISVVAWSQPGNVPL
jgi:hypothetical protein